MITLDTRLSVPDEVLFRDLDGEAVLLELSSGRYYGLNGLGTRIWQLLGVHGAVEPVYAALLEEYDVPAEQLREDVLTFVEALVSQRLLAPA